MATSFFSQLKKSATVTFSDKPLVAGAKKALTVDDVKTKIVELRT